MDTVWQWGLYLIVWIQQFREPALDALMRWFTFMGDEQFSLLLLPFALWCVDFRMGVRLGVIFLLSVVVNSALKDVFQQPRPYDLNPDVKLGDAGGYGLPSGHAQSAAVVWGSIAVWARRGWFWLLAIGIIVLVGFSRIYLGVHFPTDVLAGWAVGAGLLGVYYRVLPHGPRIARQLALGVQLLAAILLPAALALIDPTNDTVSAMGVLAGIGVGLPWAWRFVPFSASGPWWQRGARFIIGAVVLLAVYEGLRAVFPGETSPFYFPFRYLRYGLLGLWSALGAPWLFLKLRLAQAAERH